MYFPLGKVEYLNFLKKKGSYNSSEIISLTFVCKIKSYVGEKTENTVRLFGRLSGCFSTVIPHHHHENGMICWVIDAAESGDTHSSDIPEKAGDCSGCSWFAYKVPVDTVSLNQYLTLKFAPVKILLGTWAMLSDFVIDSLEVSPCFGIYIERLHTFTFLKTFGLRAPPVA